MATLTRSMEHLSLYRSNEGKSVRLKIARQIIVYRVLTLTGKMQRSQSPEDGSEVVESNSSATGEYCVWIGRAELAPRGRIDVCESKTSCAVNVKPRR
nr:hypothetical protein CFP56_62914 [Quercus suber]